MLSIVLGVFSPAPVYAEEVVSDAPAPFAFSNAVKQADSLSMGGVTYSDAILFSMGYTGLSNGETAEVAYNLKGLYTTMSFDVGFAKGHNKNATMSVIADGNTVLDSVTLLYENIPTNVTVPVTGVSKLVIRMHSGGYDKAHYAIGNVKVTSKEVVPEAPVLVSDVFYNDPCYQLVGASVANDEFNAGGHTYANGYLMKMGYLYEYTAKLGFNFGKRYTSMSFDIAKYMNRENESYTRSAFLTIKVDGNVLENYNNVELKWNDISYPVEIDLEGVSQVNIHISSNGYDTVNWVIGNVQYDRIISPGDTNFDDKVNISDASLILKKIAKWDVKILTDTADVTGDGKVNLSDVSLILKKIAKWDVELK